MHRIVGRSERQNGLRDERLQLVALCRCVDVLVILDIVHDRQLRTIGTVTPTTNLFAGAEGFHLAAVGRDDYARTPHPPLAAGLGEVAGNARIGFQLGLDGFQHLRRLLEGVHDDDDIPKPARDQAPGHKGHADLGGLCLAARRGGGVPLPGLAADDSRQACVEVLVQLARLRLAVVREVMPVPIFKARDRVADFAAAFGNCCRAGVPAIHVGVDLLAQAIRQEGQSV